MKCFMVKDSGFAKLHLRRYVSSEPAHKCPGKMGFHDAMSVEICRVPTRRGESTMRRDGPTEDFAAGDSRWPRACECGYQFQDTDEWQIFMEQIYLDDAGNEYSLRNPVPGMMYDAWWMHDTPSLCGPDGMSLHVCCPNGRLWCIDSRASNCDMKNDDVHKCWVRHGTPPLITVDKNGHTCNAGAGSIQAGDYHGFLRGGEFVSC